MNQPAPARTERTFLALGALIVGIGVALGAFGAHALEGLVSPERLGTFETGVRYQLYHGLGLLGVAFAASRLPGSRLVSAAGWLLVAGVVIFSGSLYLLVATGATWWGAVTPLGGVAFLAGWGCLVWAALRAR